MRENDFLPRDFSVAELKNSTRVHVLHSWVGLKSPDLTGSIDPSNSKNLVLLISELGHDV